MKREFRDKRDFMRWVYSGSGMGGASASELKKFNDEVSMAKVSEKLKRDGSIQTAYKIALKNKIIKLQKRKPTKKDILKERIKLNWPHGIGV